MRSPCTLPVVVASAFFFLTDAQAGAAFVSMNAGLDLSPAEVGHLTAKADKGDGDAAWRLYLCYDMARVDKSNGERWLTRAAELQNPNAEREVADEIKNGSGSFSAFGRTRSEAYLRLLEPATRTDGQACYELAASYADGRLLPVDLSRARFYYACGAKLADRMCWEALSQFCHEGKGGPRDYASAYYWIALETRCVSPDSVGGKEEWLQREEIARHLSLSELRRQWQRIDQYIDQVRAGKIAVHDTPFGKGIYYPDESKEDRGAPTNARRSIGRLCKAGVEIGRLRRTEIGVPVLTRWTAFRALLRAPPPGGRRLPAEGSGAARSQGRSQTEFGNEGREAFRSQTRSADGDIGGYR
jgi:hypothetical protein